MALFLHLGSSGTGKTYELYRQITKQAAQDFNRNFLMIVPEQFTLQTQRDMIAVNPNGGIMNIDVLSFPRMAHRVFEELGITPPVTLEDTGKIMIVKKVALDVQDKLGIYAGKVHRQGFIKEMKSVIAEFYQYGIGPEELNRMKELAGSKPQLLNKLKDISIVYEGFKNFISGRFIMNEELLELFIERAPESKVLKDACICFDGFTGFTVMQFRCIERLLELGCEVHVALTIDAKDADKVPDEEDLFCLSEKTIAKLTKIADKLGVDVNRKLYSPAMPYRFNNTPALAALEQNLFRNKYSKTNDCSGIRLLSYESPSAEIRGCICEIRRLTKEENYRYSDIGVIVGDTATYGRIADREFKSAGIPLFLDSKKNIMGTAPVEFLRALLEISVTDFSYESVFRFLKSGLTDIEPEAVSQLENFVLARAIRGAGMWKKEWKGGYRTAYALDLEAINASRAQAVELLAEPVQKLSKNDVTVAERIAVLRDILSKCSVKEKLEAMAESGKDSADYEERLYALENAQLYETVEKVFERIELLLGDDAISREEFEEILNTGFTEAKLALVPQGSDSVVIGDMQRTRLNGIKALFILGCNDGMMCAAKNEGGILSDADRGIFAEYDIELSPTGRQSAYLNEFYLYLNLTKPSERLYISYHRMTAEKKPGRPFYIYSKILRIFDGLEVENCYASDEALLVGSDRGRRTAAELLRKGQPEGLRNSDKEILYHLMTEDSELYLKLIEAAFKRRMPERITPANAKKLYGDILTGSVTTLEKYASCAFAHFLQYGLKLEERPEYTIGSIELGNIYHKALELYCKALQSNKISWHSTEPEIRREYEEIAVNASLGEYEQLLGDSKRNEYIKTRVSRILSRTIEVLDMQVKTGKFEPESFETSFNHVGDFMRLKGKIDRMDICEKNGRTYLRIVDYKSGSKSFDLKKLFYGLQIQLAVYMSEGMKELAKTHSESGFAGMYYYNIDDPLVELKEDEDVEEKLKQQLRLQGRSLDGAEMLGLHDANIVSGDGEYVPSYASNVIEAKTTQKQALNAHSKVYTAEQFEVIGRYVEHCMKKNSESILNGIIEVNPYEDSQTTPCGYCAYAGVCGFERRFGDNYRKLTKESEEVLWAKLNGVLNSEQ